MKILLDTHLVLWALADERRLSAAARRLILDRENYIVLSVASLWEMAIKAGSGKLSVDLGEVANAVDELGFEVLDVRARHVRALQELPEHHRDPFDRMLIAQLRRRSCLLPPAIECSRPTATLFFLSKEAPDSP